MSKDANIARLEAKFGDLIDYMRSIAAQRYDVEAKLLILKGAQHHGRGTAFYFDIDSDDPKYKNHCVIQMDVWPTVKA